MLLALLFSIITIKYTIYYKQELSSHNTALEKHVNQLESSSSSSASYVSKSNSNNNNSNSTHSNNNNTNNKSSHMSSIFAAGISLLNSPPPPSHINNTTSTNQSHLSINTDTNSSLPIHDDLDDSFRV